MTLRTKLREEVTRRFVPELKRRGFSGPEKISGNAILHDFTRIQNGRIEHLCVQFEKRQRPRFILNVWVESPGGIEDLIRKEGTLVQGRISQRRGVFTGSWFRADRPWWQRLIGLRSGCEEEAVTQAIARLDAIDRWYEDPKETDVVRVSSIAYRNPEKPGPNQSLQRTGPSARR